MQLDEMFRSEQRVYDPFALHFEERARYDFYKDWITQQIFDQLVDIFPKYDRWIVETYVRYVKKYNDNLPAYTDFVTNFWQNKDQLQKDLEYYDEAKKRNLLPSSAKDIMRFKTFQEFRDVARSVKDDVQNKDSDSEDGEAETIYDKDGWVVVIPKDKAASCKYGSNTKWCTAATQSENDFEDYNSQGPLYIVIDKESDRKWQFHPASNTYMDEEDLSIEFHEYFEFPKELLDFLTEQRIIKFPIELVPFRNDLENLRRNEWIDKYKEFVFKHFRDLEYLIDIYDTQVDYIISQEGEEKLQDWLFEDYLHNADFSDVYEIGYNNPEEVLDEEPEGENNTWSEEQKQRAAEMRETDALDDAVDGELYDIKQMSFAEVRNNLHIDVKEIIFNTQNWDKEMLANLGYGGLSDDPEVTMKVIHSEGLETDVAQFLERNA